ncbi:MAG: TRAP transporter small permease, partial [Proteobacteria bacterium]|nr:TRAP transporter small permease [Pseudomonadota bacterium]
MWFERWQTQIDVWMGYISALMVVVTMLLVSADVVGRYVFDKPLPGTFEFSEVLLALIIFLALPYVQYKKSNIAIEMISDHYPPKVREVFEICCMALGAVVFGFLAERGVEMTLSSWAIDEISEGTIPFPMTPFK